MRASDPTFTRYELLGVLGRGGFATVYHAHDRSLGREVALKVLRPHIAEDADARVRFLSEARRIAQLHHPNIITVHDVGTENDVPYFTMEVIDGKTLSELAPPGTTLELAQIAPLMGDLAKALDYLHARRVVHRDIKAPNVMVEDGGRVVLMDFGIARVLDATPNTPTGFTIGTPEAMAPEQVIGASVGPAADIYALGVLVYRLLAGRPPFIGDLPKVMFAHVHEVPPPLRGLRPGLPDAVYEAVDEALAKDPEFRPATARIFASTLLASAASIGPQPLLTPRQAPEPSLTDVPSGPTFVSAAHRRVIPPTPSPAIPEDDAARIAVLETLPEIALAPEPVTEQKTTALLPRRGPTQAVSADVRVSSANTTSAAEPRKALQIRKVHAPRGLLFGGMAAIILTITVVVVLAASSLARPSHAVRRQGNSQALVTSAANVTALSTPPSSSAPTATTAPLTPSPTPAARVLTAAEVPDADILRPGASVVQRSVLSGLGSDPGEVVLYSQFTTASGCIQPYIDLLRPEVAGHWGRVWDATTTPPDAPLIPPVQRDQNGVCFPVVKLFSVRPLEANGPARVLLSTASSDASQRIAVLSWDGNQGSLLADIQTTPAAETNLSEGQPATIGVTENAYPPPASGLNPQYGQPTGRLILLLTWVQGTFIIGGQHLTPNCSQGTISLVAASETANSLLVTCPDSTSSGVAVSSATVLPTNVAFSDLATGDDVSLAFSEESLQPTDPLNALPVAASLSSSAALNRKQAKAPTPSATQAPVAARPSQPAVSAPAAAPVSQPARQPAAAQPQVVQPAPIATQAPAIQPRPVGTLIPR